MAKRFLDTRLVREKWFRRLPSSFKSAWLFIVSECDEAGSWSIDEDALEFFVGTSVDLNEFVLAVNVDKERVRFLDHDLKLWVTGFVSFQYGELSSDCRPHQKVIQRLKELTLLEGYGKGIGRDKEEEEDKEKEKEEEKGGAGENIPGASPQPAFAMDLSECKREWTATLEHFGIQRPLGQRDEIAIARGIQAFGSAWVKLAFAGARKQTKGKNFDPKHFVSLATYLHKDKIERLVNIGAGKESAEGIDWSAFMAGGAS
jgi:hypothetical protein